MKFNILIDESCEQTAHETICGEAFTFDEKRKFALFGGKEHTALVHLDDPSNVIKQYALEAPHKWSVSNYEWDPLSLNGNERFLQTRNKLIELVNSETGDLFILDGHGKRVNDAKWSPFKRNVIASSSADSNIILWKTDSPKPAILIPSCGEPDYIAWNKLKDDSLAVSVNNDIRIYDIRKTNSALRYISNAHTKKIYSLDWCASEEILLSSSRDRNIKLWNFNMRNQKFMEKILEDFPCWKAKFTPYGLCFAVIPTCLSDISLNTSEINAHAENSTVEPFNVPAKNHTINNKRDPTTSILICQIMSFDESKIYKFTTNHSDMILNYDFYQENDKFKIVSWTQNQNLCQQSIDLVKLAPKELDKSTLLPSFDRDGANALETNSSQSAYNPTSVLQIKPDTTRDNSRKNSISSISEYGYGTPPTNLTFPSLYRESINLNDLVGHDFLKKNPKCFGAKFCGLPNHFLIFANEGVSHNSTKVNQHESLHFTKRMRSHTKSKGNAKTMYKHMAKRTKSKAYVYDVTFLLAISQGLAENYFISEMSLKVICEKNIDIAVGLKRFDIVKIWELVKFVTYNNIEEFSLNPDDGRPWSCSVFGRPLVTSIIDNCIRANDIQSAAMIIARLKQHDMNMIPLASTVNRRQDHTEQQDHLKNLGLLDPQRLNEFDIVIKFYSEILYQWSLYNKRIEILEYICEKPNEHDEKFECSKICTKCSQPTNNSKCAKCKTHLLNCSICNTPVSGLSTYCVLCGHGGHYDHLIQWFKRHDDCPKACGCRCVDFL